MTTAERYRRDAKCWEKLETLARRSRLMTSNQTLIDTIGNDPGKRIRFERLPDGRIAVEFGF